MKKWIVAIGCTVIAALIVVLSVKVYRELHRTPAPEKKEEEETWFPGERGVKILREEDPTDIIWYGKRYTYPKRYPFEFDVPVRYENECNEELLNIRKGYNRAIIVVSDRKGNYDISREALEACVLRAIKSNRYYFLYLGSERVNEILDIIRKNTDSFEDFSPFSKEIGSLGVFKRADGNVQFEFDPVIEASDSEEDGWIWEYFANAAEFGIFDGTFLEKNNP